MYLANTAQCLIDAIHREMVLKESSDFYTLKAINTKNKIVDVF